jgi:hypothetical protein
MEPPRSGNWDFGEFEDVTLDIYYLLIINVKRDSGTVFFP